MVTNARGITSIKPAVLPLCRTCPPARTIKPVHWFMVLEFLDRGSLIQLMGVSRAFCSLVEDFLIKYHDIYHPRHVPKLETLVKSKYYFFNPCQLDIKKFLLERKTTAFMVHGGHYSGNFLKVKASFLNAENEYFEEFFGVVPALSEMWHEYYTYKIGDLRLVPLSNFPARGFIGSIFSVNRQALMYDQTEPLELRKLALIKAATTLTKGQVMNLNLPKQFKNELFELCPERRYSDKTLMRIMNPNLLQRFAELYSRHII